MSDFWLMCKNKRVCNLSKWEVFDAALLPGLMQKYPCAETFSLWMKNRYSSGTNTTARMLRGLLFGQGNRNKINITTHALSLTDCYWITNDTDISKFEDITPYYNKFWTLKDQEKQYHNEPIPTLYTCGAKNKFWKNCNELYKLGDELSIEIDCINLCKYCNIPVESGTLIKNGILVYNFTTPDVMLEQANMSGRFDEEEFTSSDIIKEFDIYGVQMLTIDTIIGNGDRHTGNFGYLRDANTGAYIGFAPLYDFDHALDTKNTKNMDILIEDLLSIAREPIYENEIIRICDIASTFPHDIFSKRAALVKNFLLEKENDYLEQR